MAKMWPKVVKRSQNEGKKVLYSSKQLTRLEVVVRPLSGVPLVVVEQVPEETHIIVSSRRVT